jgi:hypothetical protein
MTEGDTNAAQADVMDMFDATDPREAEPSLVCRVCGSLVAAAGTYPRAHWDWHEASNGV